MLETQASDSDQKFVEKKEKRRSFLPAPKSYVKQQVQVVEDPVIPEPETSDGSSDLCIGDRVCIGGVKFGTLLYYGTTHITGGLWCGVELDDPEGKHDGQVEGVQYFHCKLGHGIFAPAERVALVEKHGEKSIPKPVKKRKLPEPQTYRLIQSRVEEKEFSSSEDVSVAGKEPTVDGKVLQPNTKLPRKTVHFSNKEKTEPSEIRIAENKLIEKRIVLDDVNSSDTDEEVKSKKVKPSRLPGFSRLPQTKKPDTQTQVKTEQNVNEIKEDKINVNQTCVVEPRKTIANETFDVPDKTFTFPDNQGLTDSGSSNDDSLSLDAKQCLASDGRQYLNLTFDTESAERGISPPNISTVPEKVNSQQDLDTSGTHSLSPHHSQDSSLGLLNPDLVKQQSQLVDDINLTDSEKILKASKFIVNVRSERVASLNDTFDLNSAVTSTPLVRNKVSSNEEKVAADSVQAVEVKRSLNQTFDHKRQLPQLPVLSQEDFKSNCQDRNVESDTKLMKTFDKGQAENENLVNTFNVNNCTTVVEDENIPALVEDKDKPTDNLLPQDVNENALNTNTQDIVTEDESKTNELIQNVVLDKQKPPIKGPMIDSGISLKGDFDPMTESNMAESLTGTLEQAPKTDSEGQAIVGDSLSKTDSEGQAIVGDSLGKTDSEGQAIVGDSLGKTESEGQAIVGDISSQILAKPCRDKMQEMKREECIGGEEQLAADLLAGHKKKTRPLSLISTASVDTGYVPDTDSEMGTLTVNSPTDWTERPITETDNTLTHSNTAELQNSVKPPICLESDSDLCSDAGTILATDTEMEESDSKIHQPVDVEGADNEEAHIGTAVTENREKMQKTPSDDTEEETTPTNIDSPNDTSIGGFENGEEFEISGIAALLQTEKGIMDESICLVHGVSIDEDDGDQIEDVELNNVESTNVEEELSEDANINIEKAETNTEEMTDPHVTEELGDDVNSNIEQVETNEEMVDSHVNKTNDGVEQNSVVQDEIIPEESSEKVSTKKDDSKPKMKVSAGKVKKATKKKLQVIKVDHKKPNVTNVGSRIADYIKTPLPTKPASDHNAMENGKNKKNLKKSNVEKRKSTENICNDNNTKVIEIKTVEKVKAVKDVPKITIKKSTPKSKWGNIMQQIEAHKDDHKPKPKTEVKSKLEIFRLSTPPPSANRRGSDVKKESKANKKIQSSPMPDFSKIKSKLNLSVSAKPESSPATKKNEELKKKPPSRKSSIHSITHLDLSESQTSSQLGSNLSSARSTGSRTDVSMEGNTESQPSSPASGAKISNRTVNQMKSLTRIRHHSTGSTASDVSQESVKVANIRNAEKSLTHRRSIAGNSVDPKLDSATKESRSRSTDSARRANAKPATPSHFIKPTSTVGRGIKPTPNKTEANQNKNKTTKTKNNQKPSSQRDGVRSRPTSAAEIARLEALCEARTKELTFSKLQLRSSQLAFDAMSVLVNYLSHDLDAFSCPELRVKLCTAHQQLEELQKQNDELLTLKQKLNNDLQKQLLEQEEHVKQLIAEHENTMLTMKKALLQQHTEDFEKVERRQSLELKVLKESHELQLKRNNSDHNQSMSNIQLSHQEEILTLRSKQELQMEELHKQHRDKLEDITRRFEGIKIGLSDKVESLRCECEELRTRARMCEDALQRDSDKKVQLALAPFINLPREIESLKAVLEMKNEEIQKLRLRNVEVEKQLEELPKAQEKIVFLQQKLENVEAIVSIKTDHEKQLHEKCQRLMRKFEKESKTNKRLSMDYEELMWRMSQSSEFGSQENLARRQLSHSPPDSESSSPDISRKFRSPIGSDVEHSPSRVPIPGVVYRRHHSNNESSSDRKLKHRSATFIVDGNRRSPNRSPVPKRLSPGLDYSSSPPRNGDSARMTHSLNDIEIFETPQGLPSPIEPPGLRSITDSSDALLGVRIDDQICEEPHDDEKPIVEGTSTLSDISESLQDTSESFSHDCGIDMSSQDEACSSEIGGPQSDHSDDVCSSPIRNNVLVSDVSSDKIGETALDKGDNSIICSENNICDMRDEVFVSLPVEYETGDNNKQCQISDEMTVEEAVVYSASQDQSHDHVSEESCDTVRSCDTMQSCDNDSLEYHGANSVTLETVSPLQLCDIKTRVLEAGPITEARVPVCLASNSDELPDSESDCIEDKSQECVQISTCYLENSNDANQSNSADNSMSDSVKLSSDFPLETCNISGDSEQDLAEDSRTKSTLETHSLVCSADDTGDSVAMENSVEEMFILDMDANNETDLRKEELSPQTQLLKSEPSIEGDAGAKVLPVRQGYRESTV